MAQLFNAFFYKMPLLITFFIFSPALAGPVWVPFRSAFAVAPLRLRSVWERLLTHGRNASTVSSSMFLQ